MVSQNKTLLCGSGPGVWDLERFACQINQKIVEPIHSDTRADPAMSLVAFLGRYEHLGLEECEA